MASPRESTSARADRLSREAHASGTRAAHAAAAYAHIDAHASARTPQAKAHHDRMRGEHARIMDPHLFGDRPPSHAASVQRGAKGGTFVISASGKKRYVKR